MKKAMLTSIMAIAVTGLLALFTTPAMAWPDTDGMFDVSEFENRLQEFNQAFTAEDCAATDPTCNGDDGVLAESEEEYPDDGGSEGYAPPEYPDDGGGEGYVPPEYPDDGGSEGYHNPGNPDNPTTPEPPKTPPSSSSGSKLPNTGTQMAIFAAIGLVVIATAYAVRRATARRSQ